MSAKHKLLPAVAALLLLGSMTACTAAPESLDVTDISSDDITQPYILVSQAPAEAQDKGFRTFFHNVEEAQSQGFRAFLQNGEEAREEDIRTFFYNGEAVGDEDSRPFFHSPPPTVAEITPDFTGRVAEKQAQNADTVGWLYIPGTDIDEVVVQNPADTSNDYYLNVNFDGQPDRSGVYCIDLRARIGSGLRHELSRITAIYGHSWDDDPDGELFAQLKRFRDPEFARENPYIYFSTGSEDMVWEVFAVFEATTELSYNFPNLPAGFFFDMLDLIYDASLYSYDVAVGPDDKVLTLSTCVFSVEGHASLPAPNDYRFAVMARLVEPDEPLKEAAVFAVNQKPLSPDGINRRLKNGAIRDYGFGTS